jgi:hypothetical protein
MVGGVKLYSYVIRQQQKKIELKIKGICPKYKPDKNNQGQQNHPQISMGIIKTTKTKAPGNYLTILIGKFPGN